MEGIEIKYYSGGKDVLLILTGIGGTVTGHMDKYKIIAENAIKNHSFSVFVATCPHGFWERTEEVMRYAMHNLLQMRQAGGKIYAMGNSAGATLLLWYAHLFPDIKKVLAINPVLNINMHRAVEGVNNFTGEKIQLVAGEKDSSAFFSQVFKNKEKLRVTVLKDVDHGFNEKLPLFISLPEKFLFCTEN